MSEWRELRSISEIGEAMAAGMEIQHIYKPNKDDIWSSWEGNSWELDMSYRARPRKPAMKKVKSLCWRDPADGGLMWRSEAYDCSENWKRFPAGDIEGDVKI